MVLLYICHTVQATRRGLDTGSKPLNNDGFLIEKRWLFDGFAEGTGVEEQSLSPQIYSTTIEQKLWFVDGFVEGIWGGAW